MLTTLDRSTISGFKAQLAVDGRAFSHGNVSRRALVEEQASDPMRFDSSIEGTDEVILHFLKSDLEASGWTLAEGLILTGADGLNYRVTKAFPDHAAPIQRLRCKATKLPCQPS